MSTGLNMLNSDSHITIVQNSVNQLKITISSVSDLQNQLDLRCQKKDTDSLLEKMKMY